MNITANRFGNEFAAPAAAAAPAPGLLLTAPQTGIDSSQGNATETPIPLSTARREMLLWLIDLLPIGWPPSAVVSLSFKVNADTDDVHPD